MKYVFSIILLGIYLLSFGQFEGLTNSIEKSKYPIEMRLQVTYLPAGNTNERVLFFDSTNWYATEKGKKLTPKKDILTLISELNQIGLRDLKSQDKLNLDNHYGVDDGCSYVFSYTKDDKVKYVTFHNPELFQKEYSKVTEFEKYTAIVTIFFNFLSPE